MMRCLDDEFALVKDARQVPSLMNLIIREADEL